MEGGATPPSAPVSLRDTDCYGSRHRPCHTGPTRYWNGFGENKRCALSLVFFINAAREDARPPTLDRLLGGDLWRSGAPVEVCGREYDVPMRDQMKQVTRSELLCLRRREVEEAKRKRIEQLSRQQRRELSADEKRREEKRIENARERMDRLNWL